MHLFLIDLFVSLDTLAPIIKTISKKNVVICNINPINEFRSLDLYKEIKKYAKNSYNIPLKNIDKIFFLLIKILFILPKPVLKKCGWIWYKIYKEKKYSSKKIIKEFLVSHEIKSVTFEESVPDKTIEKFYNAAKELNISVIKIPSGINTIKLPAIDKKYLKFCDFYLAPNKLRQIKDEKNKKKIYYIGSLRYSNYFINFLKKIYKIRKLDSNKKCVGILNKERSLEYRPLINIKNNLINNFNIDVVQSLKPRTVFPIQVSNIFDKHLLTSEVILNCNILLCARSSSVLFEALINKKKILFLNFINDNLKYSLLYKYQTFKKIDSENDLYNLIKFKKNFNIDHNSKKKIFKKFLINFFNEKKLKTNYIKFYEKF